MHTRIFLLNASLPDYLLHDPRYCPHQDQLIPMMTIRPNGPVRTTLSMQFHLLVKFIGLASNILLAGLADWVVVPRHCDLNYRELAGGWRP